MLQYFAIAENESIGRVKYNMMQVSAATFPTPPPWASLWASDTSPVGWGLSG